MWLLIISNTAAIVGAGLMIGSKSDTCQSPDEIYKWGSGLVAGSTGLFPVVSRFTDLESSTDGKPEQAYASIAPVEVDGPVSAVMVGIPDPDPGTEAAGVGSDEEVEEQHLDDSQHLIGP